MVAINCWDDYALGLLAEVLLEMGRGDEAVEAMRLVVHWTPDHGVAWEALGRIYRRLVRCVGWCAAGANRAHDRGASRTPSTRSAARCQCLSSVTRYGMALLSAFWSWASVTQSITTVRVGNVAVKRVELISHLRAEAIAAAQVSLEINPQNVLALAAWGAALTSLTKYEGNGGARLLVAQRLLCSRDRGHYGVPPSNGR